MMKLFSHHQRLTIWGLYILSISKCVYNTTSDSFSVLLISQPQSEPPLFNLSCPQFISYVSHYSANEDDKSVNGMLSLPDTTWNHLHIVHFYLCISTLTFLWVTCSQSCVGLVSSSPLIFITVSEHNCVKHQEPMNIWFILRLIWFVPDCEAPALW